MSLIFEVTEVTYVLLAVSGIVFPSQVCPYLFISMVGYIFIFIYLYYIILYLSRKVFRIELLVAVSLIKQYI
jgi:hypothetical protein